MEGVATERWITRANPPSAKLTGLLPADIDELPEPSAILGRICLSLLSAVLTDPYVLDRTVW